MPKYRITIEIPYAGCPDIVEEFTTDDVLTARQLDALVLEAYSSNLSAGVECFDDAGNPIDPETADQPEEGT